MYVVRTNEMIHTLVGGEGFINNGGHWTTYTFVFAPVWQVVFKDEMGREGTSRTKTTDDLRYEGSDSPTGGRPTLENNLHFERRGSKTWNTKKSIVIVPLLLLVVEYPTTLLLYFIMFRGSWYGPSLPGYLQVV